MLNLLGNSSIIEYSAIPVDLRHIDWDARSEFSTDGALPKSYYAGEYYKLSSFNPESGFYGDEAITECVVSDVLDTMGVEHVRYRLVMGTVLYRGAEYITPVCISKDFNPEHKPSVPLERLLAACCPQLSPLAACIQLGFSKYIYTMFVVDFLFLNRDRHGANTEIVGGIPAPLFDHGVSLVALNDYKTWNHRSVDRVNNFVGSCRLKENLFRIPLGEWPDIKVPKVEAVSRFSAFWNESKICFVQNMLTERWSLIEKWRL